MLALISLSGKYGKYFGAFRAEIQFSQPYLIPVNAAILAKHFQKHANMNQDCHAEVEWEVIETHEI